ncbi:hypothetical protein COOONC_24562 [Cooperia oncophora]
MGTMRPLTFQSFSPMPMITGLVFCESRGRSSLPYINESAKIGTVLELPYPLARDGDQGKFSRLLYALVGDDGHFKINKSTAEISLNHPSGLRKATLSFSNSALR